MQPSPYFFMEVNLSHPVSKAPIRYQKVPQSGFYTLEGDGFVFVSWVDRVSEQSGEMSTMPDQVHPSLANAPS